MSPTAVAWAALFLAKDFTFPDLCGWLFWSTILERSTLTPSSLLASKEKIPSTVLLKRGEYQPSGVAEYEQKFKERQIQQLERRASQLGYQLHPV